MLVMITAEPFNRHLPSPWFAWRMALYFGALFLIYGVHISYFPVWLSWRGLTPEQIGLITALPIFLRTVLTPAIAAHADARGNHRQIIIALSAASAILALVLSLCTTFWPILLGAVPFAIVISSIMPLTETLAVAGVKGAGHDYGRMRLWGSVTFLAATVLAGVMYDWFGGGAGIWGICAAAIATAAAALMLPKPAIMPVAGEDAVAEGAETGLLRALACDRVFVMFLLAVGAILGSHAAFYTFGALHLKSMGISGTAFGALWGISIVAEVWVLARSGDLVGRFGPVPLLMMAGVAGVLRWGAMSLDPPLAVLVLVQALHGLTYGAAHLGAIHFIARAVPGRGAGTAQALYSAIGSGLITGAATIAAGQFYPHLGGNTFLVMAALSGAGLAAAIWVHKTWTGSALLREPEVAVTPTAPAPAA